jgi:hypothetical protein
MNCKPGGNDQRSGGVESRHAGTPVNEPEERPRSSVGLGVGFGLPSSETAGVAPGPLHLSLLPALAGFARQLKGWRAFFFN